MCKNTEHESRASLFFILFVYWITNEQNNSSKSGAITHHSCDDDWYRARKLSIVGWISVNLINFIPSFCAVAAFFSFFLSFIPLLYLICTFLFVAFAQKYTYNSHLPFLGCLQNLHRDCVVAQQSAFGSDLRTKYGIIFHCSESHKMSWYVFRVCFFFGLLMRNSDLFRFSGVCAFWMCRWKMNFIDIFGYNNIVVALLCSRLQRKCTEAVRVLVWDITHSDRWKSVGCHSRMFPGAFQRSRNYQQNPRICLSVPIFEVSVLQYEPNIKEITIDFVWSHAKYGQFFHLIFR